ncbi:MAG: Mur ligase domain-containing protein, partial [Candidatus Omnitrophica bacterium]|nr:Mur ligase domain-containing protein [Candidatus Omnitrophota bacterium]
MFKVTELLRATGGKLTSGLAAGSVKGISIDSRTIKRGEAFIAIKGSNFDGHNFIDAAIKKGAGCIIKEAINKKYATKDLAFVEVKDTTIALGDIAKFKREKFNIPLIALTGSNGKTTTKEMIYWVLSKKFNVLKNIGTENNQIGLPQTLLNLNDS